MLVYAVDLGTTNVKVVLFDEHARQIAVARHPMRYERTESTVEFDPEAIFDILLNLIGECANRSDRPTADEHAVIVVTGQAEAVVLTGEDHRSVVPGLSWMDERAAEEAREIAAQFPADRAFAVSGQPEAAATWPAAKLRWFARHRSDVLAQTHQVLMIKDYLLLRLSGQAVGEATTRGFTYWYNVTEGRYWDEMLDFCGVSPDTLPAIVPAGAELGAVLPEVSARLPAAASYAVNAGALDHFCAMLGLGAYLPGAVSASSGTVLALSYLPEAWTFNPQHRVSFHPGLRDGETVLFSCADSGGVTLEWFREHIAGGVAYDELESQLASRDRADAPVFLPYLTGLNPPDFNPNARGAFVDLQMHHDRVDLAFAVMEGVAHLLRRNIEDLGTGDRDVQRIVSAGGGTASPFWNQLKADSCTIEFVVPEEPEDACRGAALLALIAAGAIASLDAAAELAAPAVRVYRPESRPGRDDRYARFTTVLERLYPR